MSLEIPLSEQEHLQQLRKVNKFVNSIDKSESYIRAAIKVSGRNILKVQNIKGKKVKIRWKKNTKVAGYQIQYSMKKNFKSGVKTVKKISRSRKQKYSMNQSYKYLDS